MLISEGRQCPEYVRVQGWTPTFTRDAGENRDPAEKGEREEGGHLEGLGCSVHGSDGLERNAEPRQNSSRPVRVQSGDNRLWVTGVHSGTGTACQQ